MKQKSKENVWKIEIQTGCGRSSYDNNNNNNIEARHVAAVVIGIDSNNVLNEVIRV